MFDRLPQQRAVGDTLVRGAQRQAKDLLQLAEKGLRCYARAETGGLSDRTPKFAELPPPTDGKVSAPAGTRDLVASVRIGNASLEVYGGASAEIVSALCKVLSLLSDFTGAEKVYIACGYTDIRKGINDLAAMVQQEFELDPFTNTLFLFCGRRRDQIKGLYWERDGFILVYKRLERGVNQ